MAIAVQVATHVVHAVLSIAESHARLCLRLRTSFCLDGPRMRSASSRPVVVFRDIACPEHQ